MDQNEQHNFGLVLHDNVAMGTFQPHDPNNIYNPEQAAYYNYYVPQEHISNMQAPTGKQHAPVGPAPHVNNGSASKRPLRPQPSSSSSVVPVSAPSAASSHVRTLPVTATGTGTSRATVPAPVANNQSAFINKLYTMLEEADQHLISWDETGTFFIVKNTTDFSKAVLPLYFKHNNFASFVRQLNMYGFHKINDSFFKLNNVCSEVWEFKHHDFRRGEYHLLVNIKRKAPKANGTGGGGNKGGGHSNGRGMYNKEAHLPNSVIGAGSSVSSSPMCNMMTPNMQGNAGGYADLGMLVGGDGGMGGDESVDELQARVYELESKL
ncbi:HSF-type DNA-binding-domain-containing protein [Chytriomyces sp. MP71]|nr:HSF-type DNA-binding-domain-containing protein [Chytriomyces sp. MP71]